MSSLYELTGNYQNLLELASDPDVDPEIFQDTLEALGSEIESKADGYAMIMRQLESDVDAIDAEIKRLTNRKKGLTNNVSRMKENLQEAMIATGKVKFKTTLFSFGIQKNPAALKIDDASKVTSDFLIPQPPQVDTKAIKDAIKGGSEFDWCHLEQSQSLRIR